MRVALGVFCAVAAVALLVLAVVIGLTPAERRFGQIGYGVILLGAAAAVGNAGVEMLT